MICMQQKQNTFDQNNDVSAIYESIGYLEEEAKKIGHTQLSFLLKNILNYAHNDQIASDIEEKNCLTHHQFEDFCRLMCLIEKIDVHQQNKMRQLLDFIAFYHSKKRT